MRGNLWRLTLPIVVVAALGCGASSGGSSSATTYRQDLGNATVYDFAHHTRLMMDREQYEIEQQDSSANYQNFKTRWRQRYPYDDEIAMGVVEIQTQLTLRARARGAGGGGSADLRSTELIAQNMARVSSSDQWILTVYSPTFKQYIDEIARDLKTEFSTGIRVFDQ
jgi:hypothetical protein